MTGTGTSEGTKGDDGPQTLSLLLLFSVESSSIAPVHLAVRKVVTVSSNSTFKPEKLNDDLTNDLRHVTPQALRMYADQPGAQVFALWLQEPSGTESPPLQAHAISAEDYEKFMDKVESLDDPELLQKLPPTYHDLASAFSRRSASALSPRNPGVDHEIHVKDGASPRYQKARPLSERENNAVFKWLQDQLDAGKIRRSTSPCSSPILVVRKPAGGLRICVDYRALNALTVKNRYPIPLVRETLSRIHGKKFFTKLDIVGAFNRIRIAEGHEWKTAFSTRYGQFECMCMPFGLCNAPATFQSYINDTLRPFLDEFCSAYLDDVLVFSDTREEHERHVRHVITRLEAAGLFIDIDKCEFNTQSTKYLGLIITTDGIRMDPAKVNAILAWETPRTLKDVQAFLGFANFYRRFIHKFSRIAAPLTALTRTGCQFIWTEDCQRAFDALKLAFTRDPVLALFVPGLETMVETDASDAVIAGVLSQKHAGIWHPVAFFSKKMTPAECNYEIYDKELLAIIRAFEEWRPELAGYEGEPTKVLTDHKNLEYFMDTKQLNARQARWAEFLSQYNFQVQYRRGVSNVKADTLTRRTQDTAGVTHDHRRQRLLGPDRIQVTNIPEPSGPPEPPQIHSAEADEIAPEPPTDTEPPNLDRIRRYLANPIPSNLGEFKKLRLDPSRCAVNSDGDLTVDGRRWITTRDDQLSALHEHHDTPPAGHPGVGKMVDLLQRGHFWPGMVKDVRRYVANCATCRSTKSSKLPYQGLLKPMPLPCEPWTELAMDFITTLPRSTGSDDEKEYENILTVVDRFTKECHFIPVASMTARATARYFVRYVFCRHGLPSHVTSDRGPQFVSDFWRELFTALQIKQRLSSSYHPQTDGQSERANQSLEQYLRAFVNYAQDDWVDWLPMAEFALNNHVSDSTGVSPFFANTGRHPRMATSPEPPTTTATATGPKKLEMRDARAFAEKLSSLHVALRNQLNLTQHSQSDSANQRRQVPPQLNPGTLVFLNTKNLNVARPSKKLDLRFAGPYRVVSRVNNVTYKLDLPQSLSGVDNAFHVSLLQPAATNPFPNQTTTTPPVESIDDAGAHRITRVLDSKVVKARGRLRPGQIRDTFVKYRVQWEGVSDKTWELAPDVVPKAYDLVVAFHSRYPSKPRPEDLELPIPPTPTNPLGAPVDIEEDVTEDMLSKELEDDVTFARAYAQRTSRLGRGG